MASLVLPWMTHPPAEFTGGAVTVGNFDGVHRGHRELVAACVREARAIGGPAVVVSFDPPPLNLLVPAAAKPPLSTPDDRTALLLAAGADRVVMLRTDAGLLALSPEAFFEDVVRGLFRARAVVEGSNFRFGRGRAGDTEALRRLCVQHDVRFTEVPPLRDGADAVSSSRIRSALVQGDVTAAAALLGHPYSVHGVVETGAQRGRTIGFPTANLGDIKTLLPGAGVYAARASVDGQPFAVAMNVGPNPTFGEALPKVEAHLIDFAGDLYGRPLTVEFIARLRDTRPFAGIDELKAQLVTDVAAARNAVPV